jgi:hypothetical protein
MSSVVLPSMPSAEISRPDPCEGGLRSIPNADSHWLLGSAREFAHAPHLFVAERGRRNGGLTRFRVLHKQFLATASPDVAHQILVTHREHYARSAHYKRLGMLIGNGLAASEGRTWRKRRALINPLLRGEHLKQLVPTVCDSVCEVLRDWEDKREQGTPIEVVRETQRLAMGAISCMLLSTDISRDTSHRLGTAMRESMRLLREYNTSLFPIPLSCPVHRKTLDRFIDGHIKSRQANGQPDKPDFLSVLMAAEHLDWTRRHAERVLGIVYMEAIVQPITWADWPEYVRSVFQGFRSKNGETMVLKKNLFVENVLPGAILRRLSDDEMAAYRAPFANAGEDRRPTLTWPRQIPIEGEPAEVVQVAADCGRWLAESRIPKLFVNAEPGAILTGRQREFCRTWRNQTEVTVEGIHFIQEDSPEKIGEALAGFVRSLRNL